jgi:hypothetical protein
VKKKDLYFLPPLLPTAHESDSITSDLLRSRILDSFERLREGFIASFRLIHAILPLLLHDVDLDFFLHEVVENVDTIIIFDLRV